MPFGKSPPQNPLFGESYKIPFRAQHYREIPVGQMPIGNPRANPIVTLMVKPIVNPIVNAIVHPINLIVHAVVNSIVNPLFFSGS